MATERVEHPLLFLLKQYCVDYRALRDANLELDNDRFHRKFGLSLGLPETWPILECINELYGTLRDHKVVVVFPTTSLYRELYTLLGNDVTYYSWHEIYTSVHLSSHDVRTWHQIRATLQEATYVFFIKALSAAPEVVSQIAANVNGCLITIG